LRRNGHAIILLLALTACGHERHEQQPASPQVDPRVEVLAAAVEGWKAEVNAAADAGGGWPAGRDCDSLLWAGLARAAGADHVNLALAEYAPGELHRRPAPSCYDNGDQGSKSTVSRDMLTGYLLGVWRARDLGAALRLADYGEAHGWVMGEGDRARTEMRTNLKGILGRILHKLGGPSREYRFLPALYLPGGKSYEQHLAVLGILLGGEVSGDIGGDQLAVLNANASDSPEDGLFQGVRGVYTGDMGRALDLLTGDYVCPGYVRGPEIACAVHRLFAGDVVLRQYSR
jgi:hypothetical protein